MEKLGKRIAGIVSLLLLISLMGCSLRIDIDPSKLGKSKPGQSQEAR